ncbi:hypothetical protein [Aquimarina sp. RZ0]|uniref:hypothetical protein n=1 Tax=Aquimarina sp. RZ0 TaxID=2607730 RepID=UPI0011F33391|nr:hypothetical protein [Aquimarina sp. RZ0]KAA1243040.1 hypothetical protein F0000_22780 [Aquimarina sp. RZ0]
MERFILFITNSNTIPDENNTVINKTISNYKSYFKSSYGGWWDESEIFHLEQPEESVFEENLQNFNEYSYSIIIFCGPIRSSDNDVYLQLNPDFEISASEINAEAKKRILIIDDCISGVIKTYNQKLKKLHLFDESLYGLTLNTIECKRLLLHKNIKECPNHTITLCSFNTQVSDELGSYYAAFLLKTVRNMIKKTYQSVDFAKSFGFLRFPEVHYKTIEMMKEHNIKTSKIKMNLSEEVKEYDALVFAIIA